MKLYIIRFNGYILMGIFLLMYCSLHILTISDIGIRPLIPAVFLGLLWIIKNNKKIACENIIYWFLLFISGFFMYFFYQFSDFAFFLQCSCLMIFQIITFLVVLNLLKNEKNVAFYLKWSLFIIIIASLMIFIIQTYYTLGTFNETIFGVYYGYDGYPRMVGLHWDPNFFSLVLTMHFFLALLYKAISFKNNKKIILLYFLCILFAMSRAGIIVNTIGCFLYFIHFACNMKYKIDKKTIMLSLKILLLIGLNFFVFYFTLYEQYEETIHNRWDLYEERSAQERFGLLKNGISSVFDYPFGTGIGQSIFYNKQFYNRLKAVHNDFVTVLIDAGIIGLFFYLLIFIKIFFQKPVQVKIILFVLFLFLNTLSCYYSEAIVPITLAMLTKYEQENEVL